MSTSLFLNLPYKVKDFNLFKQGEEEINWVKKEMPGLLNLYEEYKDSQPLKGMNISGATDITVYTAVFIELLHNLGANIRWCSSNIYSIQDHVAAYLASKGIPIFAWKDESINDYWWAIFETLHFDKGGPTHIIDEKGDISLMLHQGLSGEKNSSLLDDNKVTENEHQLNLFLKRVIAEDQKCWERLTKHLDGITIDTKTASKQLYKAVKSASKEYKIVDLNSSILKTKIDNYHSCKETIAESIKRTARTMLVGKSVLICGFGEIGKGCAEAMKLNGAQVSIAESNPIRALEAAMDGYKVTELDSNTAQFDIIITATGKRYLLQLEHMAKMKDQAILCNVGHDELEIDFETLNHSDKIKRIPITSQLTRYYFPEGHSILLIAESKLVNLTFDTTQLAFIKSCSYTVLALTQISLNQNKFHFGVNQVPESMDDFSAQIHLARIGAQLTK